MRSLIDNGAPPPDGFAGYLIAAVVAMGGAILFGFRWLMGRQDTMHAANVERDKQARLDELALRQEAAAREERLQKRADEQSAINQTQVLNLQAIHQQLQLLNGEAKEITATLQALPERVADEVRDREKP